MAGWNITIFTVVNDIFTGSDNSIAAVSLPKGIGFKFKRGRLGRVTQIQHKSISPWKINMDHNDGGLEDHFPFQMVDL